MNVPTIDCQRFDELLSEYLESTLPLPSRAQMDAHVASCARCGALLADVRSIVDRAAALPLLEPSRDLWPAVAARLETPVIEIAAGAQARRTMRIPRWAALAAAAAVLVVASSVVTRQVLRQDGGPAERVAVTPAMPAAEPAESVSQPAESLGSAASAPLRVADRAVAPRTHERAAVTYGREIERLEAFVRERENRLDPATLAIVENSMRIIDSALAEARAALMRDPASRFLTDQVDKTLQKKMELLRSVSLLAART